ncbi:MAG: hypothetical protein K2Y22_14405 [Candidatus Obscuribacterales bacterium]|nr:hypothetical protein [Candidatus Obscuribacterales bacterium]
MSDNIVCIIGLMIASFCISTWTLVRMFRRMDAEEAESRKKEEAQLYPNSISLHLLEQILESRKLMLAQIQVNGDRIAHLDSLSYESWKLIRDYLEGAYRCQCLAISAYRDSDYQGAAQMVQYATAALNRAYGTLYPPTNGSR